MNGKKRSRQRPAELVNRFPVGICGLLVLLSLALYLNTLGHGFVFDDVTLVLQNPSVTELDWTGILARGGYRPVRTFTYAVNFALGGDDPFGYHLFNILFHALAVAALFWFLWVWTRSRAVAGLSALLFAVHPVQTAAVAYISGRKDVLAALFLFGGLALYLKARDSSSRLAGFWAMTCFILAVLSKEVAGVFPLLLCLVLAGAETNRLPADKRPGLMAALFLVLRRSPLFFGGLALLAAGALSWVVFINQASRMEEYWGQSLATNIGTSFKLFTHYLKLSMIPYPLIADYTGKVFAVSAGFSELATIASVIVAILFVTLAIVLFSRLPWISVGMLWFFVALLPVLQLIPFHELAADHFLYLPLAGFCLIGGVALASLLKTRRVLAWGLVSALCVAASLTVIDRNGDWKDRKSLWEATLQMAPDSFRANSHLGQIYFEEGRTAEAIRLTRRSSELDSSEPTPWTNLGVIYYNLGQQQRRQGSLREAEQRQREVIHLQEKARQLDPDDPFILSNMANAYKELGLIYDQLGRDSEALQVRIQAADLYYAALQLPERRVGVQLIWLNFAGIFIDAGRYGEARHYLEKLLVAYPDHARGNYWMGNCYFRTDDFAEAVPYLKKALESDPRMMDGWDKLANSYLSLGDLQQAVASYQQALRFSPRPSEVHFNLGNLYQELAQLEKAAYHFREALRIDPNSRYAPRIVQRLAELETSSLESRN